MSSSRMQCNCESLCNLHPMNIQNQFILADSFKAIPKANIKHAMKNKLETTLLEFSNTERSVSVMTSENYAPSAAKVESENDAQKEAEEEKK